LAEKLILFTGFISLIVACCFHDRWEVDAGFAREKVGSLLRDRLHSQYKSSSKAKMARRQKLKATNNAGSWMAKTKTKSASEGSIACNHHQWTVPNGICEFDLDSVPRNSQMSPELSPPDVSTTTCCSSFEAYHPSLSQNRHEHSKNYFMMSSIPSSLMMPQTVDSEEATGSNWMSVLDRALFAGGATTDYNNIFNPLPFVDDIPITLNDAPISVDDIDNIFDD
jgi:hypothetical protein